jgi:hypothetical protein
VNGRGCRTIQDRDASPLAGGVCQNLLNHYGSAKLDHPKNQQNKHRRNDRKLDYSRAASISSATSAISL